MIKLFGRFHEKCVWWICALVALIPVAVVIWLFYMMK